MPDLVKVAYGQTGTSKHVDSMGMREMQARVFEHRNAQFLLVKAPPASGKSRALMFVGLDKIVNQGLRKVVVAVPERPIGASFVTTDLKSHGFFADWTVKDEWNLCGPGNAGKIAAFERFMKSDDELLVCTHATLRFAFERIGKEAFENVCLAVDEFHHVSAEEDSRLGEIVRALLDNKDTHIVAMTGSYFRGDTSPILTPADEARFSRVTYTYYEQLNGYEHLKTLGIGYHFYRGTYTDSIHLVMDERLKTIIHIPSVQSGESTKDKYVEVDRILDHLGTVEATDPVTGFLHVRTAKGRLLKVADLVQEDGRDLIVKSLRAVRRREDLDVIIALGMAKEGFDWIWCEHALTVGYRGSLTEVIQIIGRVTRDAPGKPHAQFTNLIAEPDANDDKVTVAVNNMLKAIACSLLMEQVLAPTFKFRARRDGDDIEGHKQGEDEAGTVTVTGFKEPSTERSRRIIETDLNDLKAAILQDPTVMRAAMSPEEYAPEVINKVYIPKVIEERYPGLTEDEVEEIRQHVMVDTVLKKETMEGGGLLGTGEGTDGEGGLNDNDDPDRRGDGRFVRFANRFVNIDDLSIDLIDSINPFQRAYEIMSKALTAGVLERIHSSIRATRIEMSKEEAVTLFPRIKEFKAKHGAMPSMGSLDPMERRMAEAVVWLQNEKVKRSREDAAAG